MSGQNIEQKPSRQLWIFAALAALTLHLGGAMLAVANLRPNDGDDGLGASGAEFAVEVASPKVTDDNLAPGLDTDFSQASPQFAEQKAEVKETELPMDRPTASEDPDRIVTPTNSKKPEEDDPKIEAVETKASDEAPAQEATARQTVDENAPDSEKVKAPSLGIGKDKLKLTADWGRKISAYFELHKRYPVTKSKAAKVSVSLVLNRRGNVVSVGVAESSGDAAFDEAAVSMIRRSDPVPPPPAGLTDDQFNFSLDVNFTKPK